MNEKYININKIAKIKGLKSTHSIRIAINKGKYIGVIKKDSKTQKSSLDKVKNREIYLKNNLNKIFDIFKWPIPAATPKIYSLYIVTDSELFEILLKEPKDIIISKHLNHCTKKITML